MKKVLVTGGAGFVGHHLCIRLLEHGCEVVVLDDLSAGYKENVPRGAAFIQGDVCHPEALGRAMDGCDTVFHLAARVELQKSMIDPADCYAVNIIGTALVTMECLKREGRRLVFASSCAVYPLHHPGPLSEDMAAYGGNPYALSKRVGEETLEFYSQIKRLNACSLRCFNIYGPGQRIDSPYAAVIPKFISMAKKGEPLTVYGRGSQTRDFIFIQDVIDGYILAATNRAKGIFNVGTGASTPIKTLAETISGLEGKSKIVYLPARPGDASSSRADIGLAQKILNFSPKVSLAEGLESVYQSFP